MQLDFDLHGPPKPPAEPERKVHSVSELTRAVRQLLENRIGQVWVEGEISNHRRQASGHQYFTLKDEKSQLTCVLFAGDAAASRGVKMADGQHVCLFGDLTVYEARGQYQLITRLVQNVGEGALQAKFEALKKKLSAEGLFDSDRKRALPRYPGSVGVVTSPTGAALRDFLNVLHRRHPGIDVMINPVRVQGSGAAREIAQAIREFGEAGKHGLPEVDIIVVTRGGGSIEDLWEFNEEEVARAIAASPIPVLSAIGHEIDFTIADFVADLRAPTPSAAAEIIAADRLEVLSRLRRDASRIDQITRSRLELAQARLRSLAQAGVLREPLRRVHELRQTLDQQADFLHRTADDATSSATQALHRLALRLDHQSPAERLERTSLHLRRLAEKLGAVPVPHLNALRARLDRAQGVLAAISPQNTLARGYTITLGPDGQPLTSAAQVAPGQKLRTRFADGEVESVTAKR